jgi:dienelactone hydrolase
VAGALILAGCATTTPTFPPEPAPGTVFHSLLAPAGAGPFPTVVVLHTCGGLQNHVLEWARWLRDQGYVAAVLDNFKPRGVQAVCGSWTVTVQQVTEDAVMALEHLRRRSGLDPQRFAVMGFSYGAMAALRAASQRYQPAGGLGFRAAVAAYPACVNPRPEWPAATQERMNNLYDDTVVPTLILMGEADTDSPNVTANCAMAVERLQRAGRPVTIKIFPGAPHGFDQPRRYHREAVEGSRAAALDFLNRHLRAGLGQR